MPNIFHQSVEDILKAATPEQKILWNHIFLRFGERCAISQLFYYGAIASSELSLYVARRIYVYYQLEVSGNSTPVATFPNMLAYDELNNISFLHENNNLYWDATAAAYRAGGNSLIVNNGYFSRAVLGGVSFIKFIGYRITY